MNQLAPGTVVRTVSEFINGLERWFSNQPAFKGAAISGEVSGLKDVTGGHVSFTLKDRNAVLNCIVWQSKVAALPLLKNGAAIVAVGDVRLRREQSSYQMIVESVSLTGIGELYARFEALKERFRLEGLFDTARKRKIPQFVRKVALISAAGSKASEDFLATMRGKAPFVEVVFVPSRVQGTGAEVDIREAFDKAERMDVDVIVVTRGGGSYEDLFTFNEEVVVRAIARSRHPVITAIGHQEDHHLADDVADASYGTPSKAAEAIAYVWVSTRERIARANLDLKRAIENAVGRSTQRLVLSRSLLEGAMQSRASVAERTLIALERRLNAQNPAQRLSNRLQRVAALRGRLDAWPRRAMEAWRGHAQSHETRLLPAFGSLVRHRTHRLEVAGTRLDAVDPNAPLGRGYAMILRDGHLVRDAGEVRPGDAINARLGHGTIDARVEAVHPDE